MKNRAKPTKECTTCGRLKVSSPTPDGDEICPKCWGDCMDCDYIGDKKASQGEWEKGK